MSALALIAWVCIINVCVSIVLECSCGAVYCHSRWSQPLMCMQCMRVCQVGVYKHARFSKTLYRSYEVHACDALGCFKFKLSCTVTCVVVRPVTCKCDLHGKYLHFTCKNMRVTTRGMSRECEVIVELYRI